LDGAEEPYWRCNLHNVPDKSVAKILVLDLFGGHTDNKKEQRKKISSAFARNNTELVWVPPGCTPMVQPLDVSINRAFKERLRQSWKNWMLVEIQNKKHDDDGYCTDDEEKNTFRIRPPKKQDVLGWVEDAWYNTSGKVVQKSFMCTGISNASLS